MSLGELPSTDGLSYLGKLAELLSQDEALSPAVISALRALKIDPEAEEKELRRGLNTVRHILLAETGKQTADWDFIDHEGRLDPAKRQPFPGMRIYLEDIRSPFNVGAMFRTAESFGAERIYLSPLCADPTHPRAERTAMGCTDILPWERLSEAAGLEDLEGPFFTLETGGTELGSFHFPQRAIMIVGSEELGVSPQSLARADNSLGRVSIPVYGAKGSLNVSVAFGIALQAWASALVLHETF
ncbi:TrmH family RNA methyltransferase [Treponema primitia]|uniref:TrmH family RNA methyltransferase n=1 Tax=Treponema primitia TaxID=88058 RepID=UPI00025554B1|nr:TrmH family RNA methyltransferase [Treponema primitia]